MQAFQILMASIIIAYCILYASLNIYAFIVQLKHGSTQFPHGQRLTSPEILKSGIALSICLGLALYLTGLSYDMNRALYGLLSSPLILGIVLLNKLPKSLDITRKNILSWSALVAIIVGFFLNNSNFLLVSSGCLLIYFTLDIVRIIKQTLKKNINIRASHGVMQGMLDIMQNNSQMSNATRMALTQLNKRFELVKTQLKATENQLFKQKTLADNFVRKICHDINTPTNAVVGALHLVEQRTLNQADKKAFTLALHNALALSRTLNQLTELQALNYGEVSVHNVSCCLYRLIQEAITQAESNIAGQTMTQMSDSNTTPINTTSIDNTPIDINNRQVTFKLHWPTNLSQDEHMLVDQAKLQRIIIEIVTNAWSHTQQGRIDLYITVLEKNNHGLAFEFKLTDTGPGIPPAIVQQIFDPCHRFTDFFHTATEKMSLSLVLVQKLVKLLGGHLYIESNTETHNCGTQIFIRLGFAQVSQKTARPQLEPKRPLETISLETIPPKTTPLESIHKQLHNQYVLVVDDNPINRQLLCALLKKFKIQSIEAENGQMALDLLDRYKVGLILMDCQMPIMNGFEATQIIRQSPNAHLTIIAVTANNTSEDIKMCFDSGMDGILAKPITPNRLAEKMIECLNSTYLSSQQESSE